jgi:hypothetical protein
MNITLTWADNALTLAVGVIGALIAAYLWARWPRWSSRTLTWWAERSDKSARRRLERLKGELKLVSRFQAEPAQYMGWLARNANTIAMCILVIIINLTLSIVVVVGRVADKIMLKVDPVHVLMVDPREARLATYMALGMTMVLTVVVTVLSQRVLRYSNLGRRQTFIEDQISQLQRRFQSRLLD